MFFFFYSLNTAEYQLNWNKFDKGGDFYIGLPDCDENSDGDSDLSDEKARANSVNHQRVR